MPVDLDQLRNLFIAACDVAPAQRKFWLQKHCQGDAELQNELEGLLAEDLATDGVFASTNLTAGIDFHTDVAPDQGLPKQIGRYRIKRMLGEGGMGVVYLAEQERPQRNVAIKVMSPGIFSNELLQRFEFEAAAMGRLQHPGIAQIYEAGVFDDGLDGAKTQFFAMEFIDGLRLNDYVEQNHLTILDKLNLILPICDAVNHAHQRGIIHRDLKPGNILVRPDGQTVILDFGVARATDPDQQCATMKTSAGQLVGTLAYMSPEQVSGDAINADTRSDVYSLGVITYELLTGHLPCDVRDKNLLDAARTIITQNPKPLFDYDRALMSDISTITLKALEKDPEQRYSSASTFADDIRRYLNHQPISARRATKLYQFRKFAWRNKTLVVAASLCLLLLIGGSVGTTMGLFKANREKQRLTAVNDFMAGVLVSENPEIGYANVQFAKVLRDASSKLPEKFSGYPLLEADASILLGRAFQRLSMNSDTVPLFRRAWELRKSTLGHQDAETIEAGLNLATAMLPIDAQGTIELSQQLLGDRKHDSELHTKLRLQRLIAVAHKRLGLWRKAEQELRQILATTNPDPELDTEFLRETKVSLAAVLRMKAQRGNSDDPNADRTEALTIYKQMIAERTEIYGRDDGKTLHTMSNLVDLLIDTQQLASAEQIAKQVAELAAIRHSAEHELSIRPIRKLAQIVYQQDRYSEAAEYQLKAAELYRQREGEHAVMTIVMMVDALPILEAAGKYREGEDFTRFLLDRLGNSSYKNLSPEHLLFLARFLSAQGKTAESEKLFDQVVESGNLESSSHLKCLFNLFMGEQELTAGNRERAMQMFETALKFRDAGNNSTPRLARIADSIARASKNLGSQLPTR